MDSCVLLTGPSGVGKTSIARCLAGILPIAVGSVWRPCGIFFLSQKPYFTSGSIADQITFPGDCKEKLEKDPKDATSAMETALRPLLIELGLENIANMDLLCHRPLEFYTQRLSSGEQQRLHAVRGIWHRPRYLLLDEAFSALDESSESSMYRSLRSRGIGYFSISHRSSAWKWHDTIYELKPNQEEDFSMGAVLHRIAWEPCFPDLS
jgi:ABC-type uncharacterized transport system fused permease/ATPase subunit